MKGQKKLSFHARRILEQQEQQQHANPGPTCSTPTASTAALLPTICTLAREQYKDGLREGHSELPSTFNHVHSVPQQPTARQAIGTKHPRQRMTAVAIAAACLRKRVKQQRRPSGKEHFDVALVAPAGTAAVGTSAAAAAGSGDGSAAPPAKRARAAVLQAQQEPSAAAAAGAVSADAGLAAGADSAPAQPPRSCVHRSSSPDSPAQSGPARANTNGKRYVATIDGG